ncbi:amino-acid N-acetyltransferase [Nocardiopsis algeriensis]|uniref:Amino-acid N-acetyltransferase n=1 Tax=Nocardiopsis algeriensis TaxID=1478215 RepID=A0A841IPX8_9ACTN|nr:amino-acid N-acetyltransferase [Nocardiopsis algeriensis]MBB6120899.1 amino-acid N-acetyltransferase [Nocardiopsis algeriensis]
MPVRHVHVRRARTRDVVHIRRLVDTYSVDRRVLSKSTVNLYEDIQEFWVAEALPPADGADPGEREPRVVGCGALHVLWEDLAEVRTVAVDPSLRGLGVGHRIVSALLDTARALGVRRVFCLTFETAFFAKHGFAPIRGTPVSTRVYEELLRSYDEGVAEFLDLERVKPNTLGNTRMLVHLGPETEGTDS